MIPAVILAAGLSSRMVRFKPLLPFGEKGQTILEYTAGCFFAAGITDITVVTGFNEAEIKAAVKEKNIPLRQISNPYYEQGMFTSVKAGVKSLPPCDAFFLIPVDIPLVRPATVRRLSASPPAENGVVIPTFGGKRGHPVLVSANLIDGILSYNGEGGLEAFFKQAANVTEIPTGDIGTLLDCDRAEDYETLLKLYESKNAPNDEECAELMEKVYPVDEHIVRHCRAVADAAASIASALAVQDCGMNILRSAALLHDIARKEADHAAAGAKIANSLGFPEVADLIATHMDIDVTEDTAVSLNEILFLADKLTAEDSIVSIDERFKDKLNQFAEGSAQWNAVRRRFNAAKIIAAKIEQIAGRSPYEILSESRSQ